MELGPHYRDACGWAYAQGSFLISDMVLHYRDHRCGFKGDITYKLTRTFGDVIRLREKRRKENSGLVVGTECKICLVLWELAGKP